MQTYFAITVNVNQISEKQRIKVFAQTLIKSHLETTSVEQTSKVSFHWMIFTAVKPAAFVSQSFQN